MASTGLAARDAVAARVQQRYEAREAASYTIWPPSPRRSLSDSEDEARRATSAHDADRARRHAAPGGGGQEQRPEGGQHQRPHDGVEKVGIGFGSAEQGDRCALAVAMDGCSKHARLPTPVRSGPRSRGPDPSSAAQLVLAFFAFSSLA